MEMSLYILAIIYMPDSGLAAEPYRFGVSINTTSMTSSCFSSKAFVFRQ